MPLYKPGCVHYPLTCVDSTDTVIEGSLLQLSNECNSCSLLVSYHGLIVLGVLGVDWQPVKLWFDLL